MNNEFGLWAPVMESSKKDKSAFSRLPIDLRDKLISSLDNGMLTLEAASELLEKAGHPLSHTAIANSYAKLRRARRNQRNQESLSNLIRSFQAQPGLEAFGALAKLLAAQASEALLNDEESNPKTIKAVARALETMSSLARVELEKVKLERTAESRDQAKPASRSVEDVAREIYGIEL
jgi:hypothetical protein